MAARTRLAVELTFRCWGLSRNLSAAWCVRRHDSDSRTVCERGRGEGNQSLTPNQLREIKMLTGGAKSVPEVRISSAVFPTFRTTLKGARACGIVDDLGLRRLTVTNNISYEFTKIIGEIVILFQNENYRSRPVDRPVPLLESQATAQKRDLIRREGLDMIND
jgi:hypothetical protein